MTTFANLAEELDAPVYEMAFSLIPAARNRLAKRKTG
jgi:hypothetical protein